MRYKRFYQSTFHSNFCLKISKFHYFKNPDLTTVNPDLTTVRGKILKNSLKFYQYHNSSELYYSDEYELSINQNRQLRHRDTWKHELKRKLLL